MSSPMTSSLEWLDEWSGVEVPAGEYGSEEFLDATAKVMRLPKSQVTSVFSNVDHLLHSVGAVNNAGAGLSTESLHTRNVNQGAWNMVSTVDRGQVQYNDIVAMLERCQVPERQIPSVARECLIGLTDNNLYRDTLSNESYKVTAKDGRVGLSQLVGPQAYASIANESFGNSINNLQVNTRLAIALPVMRSFNSYQDRIFFRVTDTSNIVIITIPDPVAFDLEKVADQSSEVRSAASTYVRLIDLHRNPDLVNSEPKDVMSLVNTKLENLTDRFDNTILPNAELSIKADGKKTNLFDATLDPSKQSTAGYNHTDLLAEGGRIDSVIVKATSNGQSEYFRIATGLFPSAYFVPRTNNVDSGQIDANLDNAPFLITQGQPAIINAKETTSQIFAQMPNTVAVRLRLNMNVQGQLKFANFSAQGSVESTIRPATGFTEVQAAADIASYQAQLEKIDFEVVTWIPKLQFNEENFRKTTLGTRTNESQREFVIPQGRMYTNDTAVDQAAEITSLQTMQQCMSIGNSDRTLNIVESRLGMMADYVATAKQNPEIWSSVDATELSFAATLCRPYALHLTLDYADVNVAVMRESERLAEKHAKMLQLLLNITATIEAESLYPKNIDSGETVVYKMVTHPIVADLLLSITQYHSVYRTEESTPAANGADFSFNLPNGNRIDVVKCYFDSWRDKIAMFPIREAKPADITSFGSIRDRGVFAGNIPGVTSNNAIMNRSAANSREILMVSNPIGALITVNNMDIDLGNVQAQAPVAK